MKRKGYKVNKKLKSGDFVVSDDYPMGFYLLPDNNFGTNPAKSFWKPNFKKYDKALGDAAKKAIDRVTGNAPLSVKTRADMVDVIKDRLVPLSKQGIVAVQFRNINAAMSTDCNGTINISSKKSQAVGMTPSKSLLDAFKKLGTENALSFNEEYALECLWHEIQHNNQKFTGKVPDTKHPSYQLMETVNQWVSRRTYPRMLNKLGGYKPQHWKQVKEQGLGYFYEIRDFDDLLEKLGIADTEILGEMEKIHGNVRAFNYAPHVAELLAKKSGKDKASIEDCLKKIGRGEFWLCLEETL